MGERRGEGLGEGRGEVLGEREKGGGEVFNLFTSWGGMKGERGGRGEGGGEVGRGRGVEGAVLRGLEEEEEEEEEEGEGEDKE